MPRPKVKKVVMRRTEQVKSAPIARHHSTASIASGMTFNGPADDEDSIVQTGDELPAQLPKTRTRATRAVSAQQAGSRKSSRNTLNTVGSRAQDEPEVETLVQATQDDAEEDAAVPSPISASGEAESQHAPSSGRKRQKIKDKTASIVRRISHPLSPRRTSRNVSAEPSAEPQPLQDVVIPSSPPRNPVPPGSVARVQATPSFLTNFKKQPRQPSILHMVQQRIGMVHSDDDDLTLEGETDLLADTTTTEPVSRLIDPAEDEALYDEPHIVTSSSSRKRKADEVEEDVPDNSKSSAASSPADERLPPILPSDPAELPQVASLHQLSSDELSPEDSASIAARRSSPQIENDQQSDQLPAPKPNKRPRRPGRMRGGLATSRTVVAQPASSSSVIEASSPHSTPPSSPVHSQTKTTSKGRRGTATTRETSKREKTKALTTAALQALLPRRKPMKSSIRRDTFDIHSSSTPEEDHDINVDSEEDELSRPQRRRAQPPQKGRGKPGALKSPKATRGKPAKNISTKPKSIASTTASTGKGSRTYARRSLGDKENDAEDLDGVQDDEEDTVGQRNGPGPEKRVTSAELKDARDKFLQIDKWEMEFESADLTGASSPWR